MQKNAGLPFSFPRLKNPSWLLHPHLSLHFVISKKKHIPTIQAAKFPAWDLWRGGIFWWARCGVVVPPRFQRPRRGTPSGRCAAWQSSWRRHVSWGKKKQMRNQICEKGDMKWREMIWIWYGYEYDMKWCECDMNMFVEMSQRRKKMCPPSQDCNNFWWFLHHF